MINAYITVFDTQRIFQFIADRLAAAEGACLVTVTEVSGASVRNPGAHMAVSASGAYCGSLSGGCIEKAIVAEALNALRDGVPRQVAYGAGSPIIDIRLPCGGRVDLLLNPITDQELGESLLYAAKSRNVFALSLPSGEGRIELCDTAATIWLGDKFNVSHAPSLRLLIAGHGASLEALMRQALAMDVACKVISPDPDIIVRVAKKSNARGYLLERLSDPLPVEIDKWTACVFLFHDHDWEASLISQALNSAAFFVGAMGSLTTHAARCEILKARGVSAESISRIDAPIGLIPSSRDPETLAISVLAQVVDRYNRCTA